MHTLIPYATMNRLSSFCALVGMVALCNCTARTASAQKNPTEATPVTKKQLLQQALAQAGENRNELQLALKRVPAAHREGMQFLIANMPVSDLNSLTSQFLLDNVTLAYEAYDSSPWKNSISLDLFMNDILPYSSLNEQRDGSRRMLREKSLPLIVDCKTPGEAALRLNQKLFPLLNARYSTERKKPDQSPTETIASGIATCSGLSILLVDACRAVGIPARVVGTPLWTNLRGNHTWVEVWDGEWHFTGAAEPDSKGLDHGWFTDDASKARKDMPQHSIYASSFKKTGLAFPLVWAPSIQWIPAVNVTDRYALKSPAADSSKTRLNVKVLNKSGKRVAAKVSIREVTKGSGAGTFDGTSRNESADLNDMLSFEVFRACPPRSYIITATYGGKTVHQEVKAGLEAQEIVVLSLP